MSDFIPTDQLIEMYEALRWPKTPARAACASLLVRRIYREAPSLAVGISHNGITYSVDSLDNLCRHIVTRRKFKRLPEVAKVYRVTL
jgi:hypothetical protein